MALRLRSLKTRTALSLSSVIVAILVFNAVYLTFTKWAELRKGIEQDALSFTRLTRAPIAAAYLGLYRGDVNRFRELMREMLAMNPDVVRVQILDDGGRILFDSAEIKDAGRPAPAPRTAKPAPPSAERQAALRRSEETVLHGRNAAGEETLEIIAPHMEEGGHLFVDYQVSYRRLKSEM